jgi:hypothetical protein
MASGTYGIIRGADVNPSDIQITVFYSPNRESGIASTFTLSSSNIVNTTDPNSGVSIFGGLYTLKLPVSSFNNKGIYTIMIKPAEFKTRIVDCGVLSAMPGTKGVLFDASDPNLANFKDKFENNNLTGYRIEYIDQNTGGKVRNLFRIITSNNRAEPVNQNISNTNQKAIRYRFNDNSTLVFCTVTPNSETSVKANVLPFIGEPNQEVIISNTFFSPTMLEIEMVEHDIETLAIGMFGNQTKGLEDGIYTVYNFNNDIYKQYNLFEIKDRFTGKPLYEVKEERTSIDLTKNFNDIANV